MNILFIKISYFTVIIPYNTPVHVKLKDIHRRNGNGAMVIMVIHQQPAIVWQACRWGAKESLLPLFNHLDATIFILHSVEPKCNL